MEGSTSTIEDCLHLRCRDGNARGILRNLECRYGLLLEQNDAWNLRHPFLGTANTHGTRSYRLYGKHASVCLYLYTRLGATKEVARSALSVHIGKWRT